MCCPYQIEPKPEAYLHPLSFSSENCHSKDWWRKLCWTSRPICGSIALQCWSCRRFWRLTWQVVQGYQHVCHPCKVYDYDAQKRQVGLPYLRRASVKLFGLWLLFTQWCFITPPICLQVSPLGNGMVNLCIYLSEVVVIYGNYNLRHPYELFCLSRDL